MKIWALCGALVSGKSAKNKGKFSVSHRNMFESGLPIESPDVGAGEWMPDFIVNGVNKCGTTAAAFFLERHSGVLQANYETNFFNTDDNYERGFTWYNEQFPVPVPGKLMFEKTPAYYKSHVAPGRMKGGREDLKLITVVCDNVHRTLSRYLHIQQHAQQKLGELGDTLEDFNNNLRTAMADFSDFLLDVKVNEGGGTIEGLIQALTFRLQNDMRPFNLHQSNHFEMILADGFYAVHHNSWQELFSEEQLLVVNGNNFLEYPWIPMKKIQSFLGIKQEVNRDTFIIPTNEDGTSGVPCFIDPNEPDSEANCIGKGESQKGRSIGRSFTVDVAQQMHDLFEPFDAYFAHKVLHRQTFEWNFGLE